MEWIDIAKEVGKYIASAAGGGTLVVFYFKKRISHYFDKKTKEYESELRQKADVLKTELGIYAHEQQVGISRIDQQRAEAIKNIYSEIAGLHSIVAVDIFSDIRTAAPDEKIDSTILSVLHKLEKQFEKLSTSLLENAIFISDELYSKIQVYIRELRDYILGAVKRLANTKLADRKDLERLFMLHNEEWEQRTNDVRGLLLTEFRNTLGAQKKPGQR